MSLRQCLNAVSFPNAAHGAVWKERRSLTSGNKPIRPARAMETLALLEAIALPAKQLVIIHCQEVGGSTSMGLKEIRVAKHAK